MDNVKLLPASTRPDDAEEQATYIPPAVVYEAPLEVRAGTVLPIDPLDLFGTNEN
jgi:hypothetical protein